jgi:hypothetical protein
VNSHLNPLLAQIWVVVVVVVMMMVVMMVIVYNHHYLRLRRDWSHEAEDEDNSQQNLFHVIQMRILPYG